jgi:hypothetical protein
MERRSTFDSSPGFIRLLFWSFGILAASAQAWLLRFKFSADSISYLDMSDGVLAGGDWHQLINGTWSPLYPYPDRIDAANLPDLGCRGN